MNAYQWVGTGLIIICPCRKFTPCVNLLDYDNELLILLAAQELISCVCTMTLFSESQHGTLRRIAYLESFSQIYEGFYMAKGNIHTKHLINTMS